MGLSSQVVSDFKWSLAHNYMNLVKHYFSSDDICILSHVIIDRYYFHFAPIKDIFTVNV